MPLHLGKHLLNSLFVSALVVSVICSAQAPEATPHYPIQADVSFSCLWWSEDQQVGLSLNSPPPKTTEVKITEWQYSDPVSTPHPDQVDLIVSLSNKDAQNLTNLDVEVSGEWKIGALHQRSKDAVWRRPYVLKQFHDVSLEKSGKQTLRIPVDLKSMMDELDKTHKWPFAFRSTISVHKPGSPELLSKASVTFPIIPGD
jgi:hypothetical protein